MRQQHPKASSNMLVRMKALMALVTFWILRSLLGMLVCLMETDRRITTLMITEQLPFKCLHPTFPSTNLILFNFCILDV